MICLLVSALLLASNHDQYTTPRPTVFSETSVISFSCDTLIWEQAPQLLTLQGHIYIEDPAIGTIESEDEVELRQKSQGEKWIVSHILAKGKTQLCYRDNENSVHTITSHKGLHLDGEQFILTAKRSDEFPIIYSHVGTTLETDFARLDYAKKNDRAILQKLSFMGNIRLTKETDSLRCALADQLVYHLDAKKMILSAKSGGRVLFWDEEQQLAISAKEVHITRNARGEVIKGVGKVRFAFSLAEATLIKKLFPFYKVQGGSS